MYVSGTLDITRIKPTHSEELIEAAKTDGFTLPPIPEALSDKGLEALVKTPFPGRGHNSLWFVGERGEKLFTAKAIFCSDEITTKEEFNERLTGIFKVLSDDGCQASGLFTLVGSEQGDVERWTVTNNVIEVERVSMTWANGDVYCHHKVSPRW